MEAKAGGGSRRCVDVGAVSSEKMCRIFEAQCVEQDVISRDATAAPSYAITYINVVSHLFSGLTFVIRRFSYAGPCNSRLPDL